MAKQAGLVNGVHPENVVPREMLEEAAYFHWVERGRPLNDELNDWIEVEKEIGGVNR